MTKKELIVSELQTNAKLAQKGEHQTWMAEVPGSVPTKGNILLLIFLFLLGKLLMPILPSLYVSENLEWISALS